MNETNLNSERLVDSPESDELTLDDIEAAYLQALETADAAEAFFPQIELTDDSDAPLVFETADTQQPEREVEDLEQATTLTLSATTTLLQVVEAMLFVADEPSSAKKIAEVAGGSTTAEQIDQTVLELNEQYLLQQRPYEIHLVEGGYQISLQQQHEDVRRRVFGQGPKEVTLNQDGLELLAFVAYTQPVTKSDIEATGKKKAGGILRQLLRRQLIRLERTESGDDAYVTTSRFLDLFGLASLEDLPQSEDFEFR